jgi:hypothetical protein
MTKESQALWDRLFVAALSGTAYDAPSYSNARLRAALLVHEAATIADVAVHFRAQRIAEAEERKP